MLIADSGIFGWLIILLSIVALAVIIENFVSLKRDKLAPPEIIDEIQALFDEGQFQEAMELCENEPTFLTRICGAGIAKIGHSFETIEKSIEEMGDEEAVKLHQKIGWLSVIANIAPMMGLLGTVTGMVQAFHTIATSGGQANPAELADGISVALLTTLYGVMFANLAFMPIAGKLRLLMEQEQTAMQVVLDGVLSIQAGMSPQMLVERLESYLPPAEQQGYSDRMAAAA